MTARYDEKTKRLIASEEIREWHRTMKIYEEGPDRDRLVQIRNGVFNYDFDTPQEVGVGMRYFTHSDWPKVIVRGSLWYSDRTNPDDYATPDEPWYEEVMEEWRNDDPRDELAPLVDLLLENGVEEIIHAAPWYLNNTDIFVGSPVNTVDIRCALRSDLLDEMFEREDSNHWFVEASSRLIFDRTGRWGFYASPENFGLLGGEPAFIERYAEKAGGWDFIREKADKYWQHEIDTDGWEANFVPKYYRAAGWDNPPVKSADKA